MVVEPLAGQRWSKLYGHISIAGLAAALLAAVSAYSNAGPAFSGMLMADGFAAFFRVLVISVGILVYWRRTVFSTVKGPRRANIMR